MASPLWLVKLIKHFFPSRFLLAKLTRLPFFKQFIDLLLFKNDDIMYLPRGEVIKINESVEPLGEMAVPTQILEHFIDEANYLWLNHKCICRDASKCKDYPIDLGCLFLGEATLDINPAIGRQITKQEAKEYLQKCKEAGLVHLVGRNKLDAMWLNVGPGNKLLTICSCCPCCCLWKVLPTISPDIGRKITRMPGVEIMVTDDCTGCGTCETGICFVDAIHVVGGKARISSECRICGRCASVCPSQAIEIRLNDPSFLNKSIARISKLVDVT